MSGLYLGIRTQNPVVGITSNNPGTANPYVQPRNKWHKHNNNRNQFIKTQSGIKDKVLLYTKSLGTKHSSLG
jgi:energy-converting hydrogenase Eha subunit F